MKNPNINILELSIVMPCLNEEETVAICVEKALQFLAENDVKGEVIVADNGSSDNSVEIAKRAGARIIIVNKKGYGSALIAGIEAARAKFIIMADSDNSYDFLKIMPLLEKMRQGYDLVIGNRFSGEIEPKAMPFLHKYIGNPMLSWVGRLFFQSKVGDFHCGLRGITKLAFNELNLVASGMEFASEMIVKATLTKKKIAEVPIVLHPDGRKGKPHLNSFRDGWRHLRFLLIYSPRWVFFYPGVVLMAIGLVLSLMIFFFKKDSPDIHTMVYAVAAVLIGFQAVVFAIFSKTFAVHENLIPLNPIIQRILNKNILEIGIISGSLMLITGLLLGLFLVISWFNKTFWDMEITSTMRIAIASFALIVLGFQIIFSSFFYNILLLEVKNGKI